MKKRAFLRLIVLLAVCALFTGCYTYIAANDYSLRSSLDQRYFENLIDTGANVLEKTSSFSTAKDSELSVMRINSPAATASDDEKNEALKAPLISRFVWLSDVHMPQREIRFGSEIFSNMVDELIPVTRRGKAQDDFFWAVYLSQIEAINKLNDSLKKKGESIDFMIHTGDSADRGSMEELYQFIYISNKLDIPWLNLVGNHDVTILGNYNARLGYGFDPDVVFFPISTLSNFIWMHRNDDKCLTSGYGRHMLSFPDICKHHPSLKGNKKLVPTSYHGFDLGFDDVNGECGELPSAMCKYKIFNYAGDYTTDLNNSSVPVKLIVMNSAMKDAFGSGCSIDDRQRKWLNKKLNGNNEEQNGDVKTPKKEKRKKKDDQIYLFFMHHRPNVCDENTALLTEHGGNGTMVAFTGHVHPASRFDVTWHPGKNGNGFYELNTGAIIEYPQFGRIIELRGKPGGKIWLIARALWNSLMNVREAEMPDLETIKKVTADCIVDPAKIKDKKINEKQAALDRREKKQKNIKDAIQCGYYDAYDHYFADIHKARWWDKPELFENVWKNANVIVDITPQKHMDN
jgi:hypothetical protein